MDQGVKGLGKDVVFDIKKNKIVRLLAYPYCVFRRNKKNRDYQSSEMSAGMKTWKDVYKGRRCFIIGSGPSLNKKDLESLNEKGEITFSSNRIYHIYESTDWRPDFYVAFEPEFCRTNADKISKIEAKKARFINMEAYSEGRTSDKTYWMNCTSKYRLEKLTTKNIEFSSDLSVCVNDAYSVTYTMLQLAIYMGFNEIYLLGMDHYENKTSLQSSHFYEDKRNEYRTPTYLEGIEYGYRLAFEEANKRNIRIMNATRGGSLEVFERVSFETLL